MNKSNGSKIQPEVGGFTRDQLADIYDTYQLPIYRAIFRRVSDVESARDLTADVFFRLLQAVQNGNGPNRNVAAWLYRSANNIVVDHYRRQQFRRHDPLHQKLASQAPDPDQVAGTQIQTRRAREALSSLSPNQRQVITLKFLDGLSNREIAAIMGKSTGAVKSLQYRGLASLQRKLLPPDNAEKSNSISNLAQRAQA